MWNNTVLLLGTGFGLGCSPIAPGTAGSLLGPILIWSWQLLDAPAPVSYLVALVAILLAVPICGRAAQILERNDPGQVVLDELVAFPIVFSLVPVDLRTGVAGFLWFRLFDVAKPWPVGRLEKLPKGWGIVADDLAAGAYAGMGLWVTVRILGWQSG